MKLEKLKSTIQIIFYAGIGFSLSKVLNSYRLSENFDTSHALIIFFIGIFILVSLIKDQRIKSLLERSQFNSSKFNLENGIIVIDKESGKVVYINKTACNILKKNKAEVLGKELKETSICCLLTH